MVSGNDILSYKPNPDLAGGGAYNYGPDGNLGNELSGVLNSLNNQNLQWNAMKYHDAINKRDKALETFASNNIDFPMEENDRGDLDKQYSDMVDRYKKNPKGYLTDPQTLKDTQRFKHDVAYAKTRYATFAQQRQDIAKETDPQTRQDMIAHLNEQVGKPLHTLPEPYQKRLDWDPAVMNPKAEEEVVDRTWVPNKNGLMTIVETKQTDPKKMQDHWSEQNFLEGNNKTLPDQANIYMQHALANPDINNDEYWNKANSVIDQMNVKNDFKPGGKYYMAPIAVQGEDGHMHPVDKSPIEFGKKFYIANNYKHYTDNPALSKEAQGMQKTLADQKKAEAATRLDQTKAKEINDMLPWKEKKIQAEIDYLNKKGDREAAKAAKAKMTMAKPVNDAISTFNNVDALTYRPMNKTVKAIAGFDPGALATIGTNDKTSYAEVPLTDLGAVKMTSIPSTEKGNTKMTIIKPDRIFAIRNDPSNPDAIKLIGIGKDGKVQKMVDVQQGINELISYEGGYKGKDNVKNQSTAMEYINDLQGGNYTDVSLKRIREHLSGTQPVNAPKTEPTPSATIPIDGAQLKKEDGKVKAYYNGAWHNVLKKDSSNKTIILE